MERAKVHWGDWGDSGYMSPTRTMNEVYGNTRNSPLAGGHGGDETHMN